MATNPRHSEGTVRTRFLPCPNAGILLTPRDNHVVMTALLNPASRNYHYSPLFPSIKSLNERLRQLYDHQYLSRKFATTSPFGAPIYGIGKAGVPIAVTALAEAGLDLTEEEVKALCRRPPASQIDHTLAIADVYSACCLRSPNTSQIRVVRFLPERLVRFEYEARHSETQRWLRGCFAPDGAFVISNEGSESYALFLEIDMGTVDLARFAKKYRSFSLVAAGGLAADRTGCVQTTLAIVTISERRLGRLREVALEQQCSRTILTTFAEIDRAGLSASWIEAQSGRSLTLQEIAGKTGGQECSA